MHFFHLEEVPKNKTKRRGGGAEGAPFLFCGKPNQNTRTKEQTAYQESGFSAEAQEVNIKTEFYNQFKN